MAKAWRIGVVGLLAAAAVACGPAPGPGAGVGASATPSAGQASPSLSPSAAPSQDAGASGAPPSPSPSPQRAAGPWRQVQQAPAGAWTLVAALGREDAVVATSAGQVAWTSSGGGSWTQSSVPLVPDDRLLAVGLWRSQAVWAAGRFGFYSLSADGRFWTRQVDFRSLETFTVEGLAFDGQKLVAAGRGESSRQGPPTIMESADGGKSWQVTHRVQAEPGLEVAAGGGQAYVRTAKGWLQRNAQGAWISDATLGGGNAACAVAIGPSGAVLARASGQGMLSGPAGDLRVVVPLIWPQARPIGCDGHLALGGLNQAWYAEGDRLWRSQDGGRAWQEDSASGVPTQGLVATPEGAGWRVGQSQVWAFQ